jgi:hypothetical protein
MVGGAQRPATFWTTGSNYYAVVANQGGLSSEGSNAVALTSNGFRNNAGTWTSYGAGGSTGAAQIELLPTGDIRFRTDTTKASGTAINPTQRMVIRGDGNIGIGTAGSAAVNIQLSSTITGSATSYAIRQIQTIQSDVTTAFINQTVIGTVAASFTVATLRHYQTTQTALGAGSTITNQTGYFADGTMTGAANNYGFQGAIANATQRTITNVERTSNVVTITTSAAHGFTVGQSVLIDATTNVSLDGTFVITAVPLTNTLQYAQTGTDIVSVADTGTVNSAGRFNLYMSGNAPNYLAGNLYIATLTPASTAYPLYVETTVGALVSGGTNVAATSPTIGVSRRRTGLASVISGDSLGKFSGFGWDGAAFVEASRIETVVDGTPGTNDMPGRLVFSTTPDGASTPSPRMTILNGGNVGIGTTAPSSALHVAGGSGSTIRNTASAGSSWFVGTNVDSYILHNESNTPMLFTTNGTERMRITNLGNVCIGTTAAGTSAEDVLAIGTGVAPTTGPADTIQIYSTDLSAGNTMLSIYTEGTSVNANTTAAATHRIAVRINGTVYYLLANTAA